MQTTIKSPVSLEGIGLHTGRPVRVRLCPAAAEYGIWFRRTDIDPGQAMISAHWTSVVPSELCTMVMNDDGVSVSTTEHLMAAIAGTGLHNLLIEIDGPEVPILDGSSALFVRAILARGIRRLDRPVRAIEVLKRVEVTRGNAFAALQPAAGLEIDFRIDFADAAIGRQEKVLDMANGAFLHALCDARTFCRRAEVEAMRERGLALGGSLDNAVVIDGDRVLNPGGLRHADEAVRHKMLDALGDLALAGAPIIGRYIGDRAGHATTRALIEALMTTPEAYRIVECSRAQVARLPGAGVKRSDLPAAA
ncbi:MAG: UDP-3-O-acyl-N-acetylglucosamine deacetylase [Paracoccaceae bacterium]|nr:UDP-3-O-acyl-N-acetylglucosamine deacetylase [Paracoccaceae bacterium]